MPSSSYSSTTASSFSTLTSTTTRTNTTTTSLLSTLASPTILALKRQALQAKKTGDIETAKERLRQAKSIEQTLSFLLTTAGVVAVAVSNDNNNNNNNNNNNSTTAINSLQQLATLLQQHGNEPAAIEALRQVELLQRQDDEKETTTGAATAAASSSSSSSAVLAADIVDNDTRDTPQQQQKQAQQTDNENETIEQLKEQDDLSPEDPVNKIMNDANLDELNHNNNNNNNNNETQHFSIEELLDTVILQDMRAAGMDIPTAEEYQTRIAACKRAALQAKNKQNDLKAAKRQLLLSKQLEQAMHVLYCSSNDDDDNSKNKNSNNAAADDDGEDYSLLDELMMDNENNTKQQQQQDDGFLEQLFGTSSSNTLDLDDLDHFDPLMLREMMEAGMQVPAVDDVLQKAQTSKTTAIRYKQKGDILSAKTALEESKRLEKRAHQLAEMLAAAEKLTKNDGDDDHHDNVNDDFNEKDHDNNILQDPDAMLAALEAQAAESMAHSMTRTSKKSKGNNKLKEPVSQEAQQQSQQQQQSHPQLESSHTYKVQAVQYKQQGNMQEAVKALRLYKQALAAEERAAKVQQRQDCIDALQAEAKTANKQVNYFCYYQRFIDETVGHTQLVAWKTYAQQCANTTQKLENNDGESSVPLNRNADSKLLLQEIQETNGLNFIAKTCDPDDARIEICILDVFDLHTNKNLRTLLGIDRDFLGNVPLPSVVSIRVLVTVQLPPNMEAPDDNTKLHYEPISLQENHYVFGKSQFVHGERGPTRFAKLLARRMVRRRIVLEVFHTAKKGSLFSRTTEETLLGTAVIELKDLLQSNVIAGEFPLLDHARRREVGGYMRCAIRTGSPFAEMKVEETSKKPETASNAELSSSAVIMHAFSPFVLQP